METPNDFLPTRLSLLARLKNWDDNEGWKRFFDTYWRLIYGTAIKAGLSDAEAQDVVQETVIAVAKKMNEFKYDPALGSFKGWLRNLARWRIADQLRKRTNAAYPTLYRDETDSPEQTLAELPDSAAAEAVWEAEWRENLMNVALTNVRSRVKEEHYQMFDLYVVKQWSAGRVARTLEVSMGQVYLAKYRVGSLIKKEVRRLETSEITIT